MELLLRILRTVTQPSEKEEVNITYTKSGTNFLTEVAKLGGPDPPERFWVVRSSLSDELLRVRLALLKEVG